MNYKEEFKKLPEELKKYVIGIIVGVGVFNLKEANEDTSIDKTLKEKLKIKLWNLAIYISKNMELNEIIDLIKEN